MQTLNTFNSSLEAHVLKSKLESEGIEAFLFDENTMDMNPLYNYLIGGVKLKIAEENFAKAQEILAEIEDVPFTNDENQIIQCPSCNSSELGNGIIKPAIFKEYLTYMFMPFLAIYPFVKTTSYYCKSCRKVFRK